MWWMGQWMDQKWQGVTLAGVMTVLLGAGVMLSGCGAAPTQTSQEEKKTPPIELSVDQIDLRHKIGDKAADGQYVVVKLNIRNTSNQSLSLPATDIQLETVTDKPDEHYTQTPENNLMYDFSKTYGLPKKDKLMALQAVQIHPKLDIERYVVFMMPEMVDLSQYNLISKAHEVKVPLVTETTVLNDYRQSAIR